MPATPISAGHPAIEAPNPPALRHRLQPCGLIIERFCLHSGLICITWMQAISGIQKKCETGGFDSDPGFPVFAL
jgi:hypothetical protein